VRRGVGIAGVLCLLCAAGAAAGDTAADRLFERLRRLAGNWEGTLEWSQGRTGSGKLTARYYLTGNGSAIVEDLLMGDEPTMTTVYHLDGADLRMTHFCGARNQPRLKAVRINDSAGIAEFTLVDVTNVGPKNPGYVEAFFIHILDADNLNLRFTFHGAPGIAGVENIVLRRIRSKTSTP